MVNFIIVLIDSFIFGFYRGVLEELVKISGQNVQLSVIYLYIIYICIYTFIAKFSFVVYTFAHICIYIIYIYHICVCIFVSTCICFCCKQLSLSVKFVV